MGIQRGLLLPYNRFNKEEVMIRLKKEGFTLVELIITMSIFVIGIMLVSNLFINQLNLSRQQSAIVETNVEGIIGLEILRRDIENAGYGLPWNVKGVDSWNKLSNYTEAKSVSCSPNPAEFNDAPDNPPRAILSKNNASFSGCGANSVFNGSDYLIIKSINVARNNTVKKWTTLKKGDIKNNRLSDFDNNERVIVISPGTTDKDRMALVTLSNGTWFTRYDQTSSYASDDPNETRIIYGLDPEDTSSEPYQRRMPFNRADYYIWRESTNPATDEVPDRCAPNTGVLRKAVISQKDGLRQNPLPLLDCVADMQVIFGIDNDGDGDFEPGVAGSTDGYTDDISTRDAKWIRERVKEVRVYILAQEGQMDRNYSYPYNEITVGEFGLGRTVSIGPDWKHYRWKVYTLIVKPNNLR